MPFAETPGAWPGLSEHDPSVHRLSAELDLDDEDGDDAANADDA